MKKQRENTGLPCQVFWKSVLALTACAALVSLLSDAVGLFSLVGSFAPAPGHAASVGIIGGADGPTAVFVTSSPSPVWQTLLKVLLLSVSLLGLKYLKKK